MHLKMIIYLLLVIFCRTTNTEHKKDLDLLNKIDISSNITIFNVTVSNLDKVYQFTISAKIHRHSSDTLRTSYTKIHNQDNKIKSVWISRVGSDFIEVCWNMSSLNRNNESKESEKNVTISANSVCGIIKNLQPYSNYTLKVSVLTNNSHTFESDFLYNTTLEAAPSTPPQDVRISNVTNTTLYFSWKSPKRMNGVLRYYEVYYNEHKVKVDEDEEIILKDLQPYKNYSLGVTACTVSCSDKSSLIYQVTEIGVPGKIDMLKMRFLNSSQMIVKWSKPEIAAGPLHYYEIMTSNGEVHSTNKSEIKLPMPICNSTDSCKKQNPIAPFYIRAVNIAASGEHLKGYWSEDITTPEELCCKRSFENWVIFSTISMLIVGTIVVFYFLLRIWRKVRKMNDIDVILPSGLQTYKATSYTSIQIPDNIEIVPIQSNEPKPASTEDLTTYGTYQINGEQSDTIDSNYTPMNTNKNGQSEMLSLSHSRLTEYSTSNLTDSTSFAIIEQNAMSSSNSSSSKEKSSSEWTQVPAQTRHSTDLAEYVPKEQKPSSASLDPVKNNSECKPIELKTFTYSYNKSYVPFST